MSAQSYYKRIERVELGAMDQYLPCRTYKAHAIRNNLGHLIDEYTQMRVNWVSSLAPDRRVFTDGSAIHWSSAFVHTWMAPSRPANLAVYVRMKVTNVPMFLDWDVSIRSISLSTGDAADIASWSGRDVSIGSVSFYQMVDDLVAFDGSTAPAAELTAVSSIESGDSSIAVVGLARIDIRIAHAAVEELGVNYTGETHYLSDVTVREFA